VTDLEERLQLALDDAMAAAHDPAVPVSIGLFKAARVARLRRDVWALAWILLESAGHGNKTANAQIRAELKAAYGSDLAHQVLDATIEAFIQERRIDDNRLMAASATDLESIAAALREQAAHVSPGDRFTLLTSATHNETILGKIRTRIANYLAVVEQQVAFDRVNFDAWERNRAYTDAALARVAPEALAQFQAAYRRHGEADPEALSQALMSCRRVLKTVADGLYPATNEQIIGNDGNPHDMSEDRFIARLAQYAFENSAQVEAGLVAADIDYLGERLHLLNKLASKGVHANVTPSEVEACILRTYLVVGDLLRLYDAVRLAAAANLDPA
jgi:hypothetical protein